MTDLNIEDRVIRPRSVLSLTMILRSGDTDIISKIVFKS